MNKLILIPILFGVITVIFVSLFTISDDVSQKPTSKSIYEMGFTYYDIEKIKTTLAKKNISMSTPTAIVDHTINQYCTFFDSSNIQKNVEYCTTSAILDSDGISFGNINMGGDIDGPIMAIAIMDVSPFLDSKKDEVIFVFQTMIETLVCDCWAEQQPGNFESVNAWLDIAEEKYAESSQDVPLKSKITGLDNETLILEITSVGESYRWALIVLK